MSCCKYIPPSSRSPTDSFFAGGGATPESCNTWGLFSKTTVPEEQATEVKRIHHVLQSWLLAEEEEMNQEKAGADLRALVVAPAYVFHPSPPSASHALLLSITSLYWSATTSSLPSASQSELSTRIADLPGFGTTEPQFSGREVTDPSELTENKVEMLMRVAAYVLPGVASKDVVQMWTELAQVARGVWPVVVEVE